MARLGLLLAAAAACVLARSPTPRFPYDPNTTPHCSWWVNYEGTQTCGQILDSNWITIEDFRRWNPSIGPNCAGLQPERSYCVEALDEPEPQPTTTTTSTRTTTTTTPPPATTTTPGNGVTTPLPTQPSMVSNCERFYFVEVDDSCAAIASQHGISQQQFLTWNPSVGNTCGGLWANVYVCVWTIGLTTTTTRPPTTTTTTTRTTTTAGNGISTPVPTQPGMVNNCDRFYFAQTDDSCAIIGAKHGVRSDRISTWNTGVGNMCSGLWANVYVCVRTIGFQLTTQTTCSTDAANKLWGGNKPAALNSVVLWCNGDSSTDGSGGYNIAQTKRGCYNAPLGNNKFEFSARNDFGAGATLSVAKCNELVNAMINGCDRGGSGRQEGWFFTASVREGRC